jgi:integrase/recombinase XerD
MPNDHSVLIAQLRELLTQQRYSVAVVHNYCRNADDFLQYLVQRNIAVETATPAQVSDYLRGAVRRFRQRHGYAAAEYWQSIPRSGIHALLRLVQKRWPPEPPASGPGEVLCRTVCNEYQEWLRVQRGLAKASIDALMWEGRHFLSWYAERSRATSFMGISIKDIDAYFEMRAPGLRRRSLKDVAERLRSLMRFLHRTGCTAVDLAPQIIGPMLYAYETIPSALSSDHISAVLKVTREDRSPMGLRDYAILLLLSTYGMRAGEITRLRIEDIDWRAETLRIRHSKTGAHSLLPLMAPVGKALLNYLRRGRPRTDMRCEKSSSARVLPIARFPGFTVKFADDWRRQA